MWDIFILSLFATKNVNFVVVDKDRFCDYSS